jgi:hypothetical protein
MALNFTPLSAYKFDVLSGIRQQAENRREAAQGLGAILGTAKGIADEQKTSDFFAQFDDSEEEARIVAQIKANEDRIQELKDELQALGGE